MKNNFLIIGFCIVIISGACKTSKKYIKESNEKENISHQTKFKSEDSIKILFGSCNKQDKPQPIWADIQKENGDIFLWLGDNIYGDSEQREILKKKYDLVNSNPSYNEFKRSIPRINGTWDDHDYGVNDGGKEFPAKEMSQELMLDFLDIPKDHVRRSRKGVYDKISISKKDINVDIFILDTRYFRDPIIGVKGKFKGESTGTILGNKQWEWLDAELQKSTADVHIFLSSIQLIAEEHGFEKWGNFPEQKEKFLDLISSHNINYPIILSGDRHTAEISVQQHKGYTFYDLTSSSLNSGIKPRQEANRYRLQDSELIFKPNYGVLEITKTDKLNFKGTIKTNYNTIATYGNLYMDLNR